MRTGPRKGEAGRRRAGSNRRVRPPSRSPARRLIALLVILVVGVAGIFGRLVQLQVRDASAFQALARDQRSRSVILPASRGSILDRDGRQLALSLPAKAVFVDPRLVDDIPSEAAIVASALGLDPTKVIAAMGKRGRFVYIARGVDLAVVDALQRRGLPGVGFLPETKRYYPAGDLAAQVLGFVGVDGTGLAGLELQDQRQLAGRPGHEVVEADPRGVLIPQASTVDVPPQAGQDLVLTLDRDIQYRTQVALAEAVKANRAKGGTVIVLDPATGQILAMANSPAFDPNAFGLADPEALRNPAVTDVYEPGSVNKIITASAALEENAITLNQRMMVPDHYQLYTKTFHDAHSHPTERMTLGDVIAYSSNIGAIETARLLGPDRLYAYLQRFGLTEPTGVGFPGESRGILPSPDHWSGTSMGTIPIGQGIAVTPLQMACVYAAIANGGVWVQPSLVLGTVAASGRFQAAAPPKTRRVVSEETARAVTQMLAYAVDVGTGTQAQIPGYWVAGKTGTARKVLANGTGYSDKYMASFIGFAPAGHPAVVIAAVLDEPATVFGGVAAAPLFRQVALAALAKLRAAPAPKLPIPPHAITIG